MIPNLHDAAAERALAGVAALSQTGAVNASEIVGDLYDPTIARTITTATDVDNKLGIEARIDLIADLADVPRPVLCEWVSAAPTMWDLSGSLRARVRDAAARRRRVESLLADLEDVVGDTLSVTVIEEAA